MPLSLRRQRGAALLIALIMLVLLSLLAITAARFGLLGTRTSLSFQLQNTVFQTAEVGLVRGLTAIESGAADIALDAQNVPQPSIEEEIVISAGTFTSQVTYRLTREESIIDNGSSLGEGLGLSKVFRYRIDSQAKLEDQYATSTLEQGYTALQISE